MYQSTLATKIQNSFSDMDTYPIEIHTDKARKTVAQSNKLINTGYEMSTLQKQISIMVFSDIKKDDPADKRYIVPIDRINEYKGTKTSMTHYKEAIKGLMKIVVELPEVKEGNDGEYIATGSMMLSNIFTNAFYVNGKYSISVQLNTNIRPYLFNLQGNYTISKVMHLLQLGSWYNIRIGELVDQWADIGYKRFEIMDLRYSLGLYGGGIKKSEIGSKKGKYYKMSDFDKHVMSKAKDALNNGGTYQFNYKYIRTGRSVTHVDFFIEVINIETLSEKKSMAYKRLTEEFKLSKEIANHSVRTLPIQLVNFQLYIISLNKKNVNPAKIGGYTRKCFDYLTEQLEQTLKEFPFKNNEELSEDENNKRYTEHTLKLSQYIIEKLKQEHMKGSTHQANAIRQTLL